ncbi:MAG TPA: hypothetical protein VKU01_06435 [Bryobacteraceae bacterium]|nr:hypothetical protein [Bryobacteraceae bacterium]
MQPSRSDLIQMFVLDAIADDYENLAHIKIDVTSLSSRAGLAVEPGEVTDALIRLIERGLATAFNLRGWNPPEEYPGIPPSCDIDEYYFWTTSEGKKVQLADYPEWPFDEDNNRRNDWQAPSR